MTKPGTAWLRLRFACRSQSSCCTQGVLRASVRHTDACHSQGAQGTDSEHPQAGSCQTAKDDGGKPGVRFLARSKRGTRFRTASLLGGTKQRRRRFWWGETKEGDAVGGARLTIEIGAEFPIGTTWLAGGRTGRAIRARSRTTPPVGIVSPAVASRCGLDPGAIARACLVEGRGPRPGPARRPGLTSQPRRVDREPDRL